MAHTVTVGELLDGHAGLEIESLDRIYLNGYVLSLQSPGGVIWFLNRHLGYPIPSPALFGKLGRSFRSAVKVFAEQHEIPFFDFTKRQARAQVDRTIDAMRPYLDRQAATGRSGVAAIVKTQEVQKVFDASERKGPNGLPWFRYYKAGRRVICYYFYLWDTEFGPAFIKVCAYFPYPIKVWVNGHEWAKRQATQAGIGFTELSNGFASCDDPAGLQAICDSLGPDQLQWFFERWCTIVPLPLTGRDWAAGFWWELSMRQIEVSRTIMLDTPRHARSFFEALIADNLDIGRPERVEMVFKRRRGGAPAGGVFKTKIDQHATGITINAFYKKSRIKQYLKDGRALRIETVVNNPRDFGCLARLHNLDELQHRARACNHRLLHAERVGQGCVLASPAFERIAHPSVTTDGRRAPALRFGNPRVHALAGALCATMSAVTGITNKSLRALMPGLLGGSYTMNQASYDLGRLRDNGLIQRIPGHNRYTLTPDGLNFAIFYTKIYARVLRPCFATDQRTTPPDLRAALRTIDQHITERLTQARLPALT